LNPLPGDVGDLEDRTYGLLLQALSDIVQGLKCHVLVNEKDLDLELPLNEGHERDQLLLLFLGGPLDQVYLGNHDHHRYFQDLGYRVKLFLH